MIFKVRSLLAAVDINGNGVLDIREPLVHGWGMVIGRNDSTRWVKVQYV